MTPGKVKFIKVVSIIVFSAGTYIIYMVSSSSSEYETSQKINEEASKASISDRLRANDLMPVELAKAKIEDAETQKLENKGAPNNANKEFTQAKKNEEHLKNGAEISKSIDISPWNAALSGRQSEQTETGSDPIVQEVQNTNSVDALKAKDAQNFVQMVSTQEWCMMLQLEK